MAQFTTHKPLPPKKPPGLLARFFTAGVGMVFWLLLALLLSIALEWIGIAYCWPAQGHHHAEGLLHRETRFLHHHLAQFHSVWDQTIHHYTRAFLQWAAEDAHLHALVQGLASSPEANTGTLGEWRVRFYRQYQAYILATPVVVQLFCVRLAIIVFSLPVFVVMALVGVVDGLVERDLRRWGGGRESSNLYNLARKTVFPLFIVATVVYLSSPISLHPAGVMMPFAIAWGLAIQLTFSRLKKYF